MKIALAIVVLISLAGCATSELVQEPRVDAALATRIKAKLIADPAFDAAAVNIDSDQGKIVLSGFVETNEQSREIAAIAAAEAGVVDVVNRLVVK